MYGGCLTDNATNENGAGVYLYNVAKMTMYGGTITGNNSVQGAGGGVWSDKTARLRFPEMLLYQITLAKTELTICIWRVTTQPMRK